MKEVAAVITTGPGQLLIGWGERYWHEGPHDSSGPYFYFPDFFLRDRKPWFTHEHHAFVSVEALLQELDTSPKCIFPTWENSYRDLFFETFANLQKSFSANTLKKAVPFIFEKTTEKATVERIHQSLVQALYYVQSQKAFLYGFWGEEEGILGVTPELLCRVVYPNNLKNWNFGKTSASDFSLRECPYVIAHRVTSSVEKMKMLAKPKTNPSSCLGITSQLTTAAVAGTARGDGGWLLTDPKERNEHAIVIEGITESLAPYGTIHVGTTEVLQLPTLSHLYTPIQVDVEKDASFSEFVALLHPTPALGAFPKKEGQRWLENYQTKIPRKRFGAPVGYYCQETGEGASYVAIRNVQWDATGMQIGSGCGIVPDSQVEKEWNEIQLKIEAIKKMLVL